MPSKRKRTRYDEEFKKRAVRLSNTSERTVKEVADSLGIQAQLLYRWRKLYTPEGEKTKLSETQDENSTLRQRSLTDSRSARDNRYKNLVKNQKISKRYQVLSSDITHVPTAQGFEYQCNIIDVYSKEVLGSAQGPNMKAELVESAIKVVVGRHDLPKKPYFHTDRGSQYTSKLIRKLLKKLKWIASYSRVGKPGDNAWSESFFALLKKEVVHGANFKTREEARDKIFSYIYDFYNPTRKQQSLGYLSPHEFIKSLESKALANVA